MTLMSHSRWNGYLRCPNQLRLRKGGFPVVPSWPSIAGRAFHATGDRIDRALWVNITPPDAGIELWWSEEFAKEVASEEQRNPDQSSWRAGGRRTKDKPNKEDGDWWRTAGAEMAKVYRTWRETEIRHGFDIWEMPDGNPATEVQFDFELCEGVRVRGAIDRILVQDGTLLVRDLKTTQREPNDSSQLGIYKLAIERMFDETVQWGDYYLARPGAASTPIDLSHYTQELFEAEYGAVAKMMAQGLYPSNPGDACGYCDVKDACAIKGGRLADDWRFVTPR